MQQGVVPDATTYGTLISASEKGKQPERALKVLEAMVHQGVVPDAITYGALITACEKGEQWERALKVFEAIV